MENIKELYQHYISSNANITTDSRNISKNALYFALKGDNFDGNEFVFEALEKGASFAITDNIKYKNKDNRIIYVDNVLDTLQRLAKYHRKQLNIPFIGITGTNGKTTTKELIKAVLDKKYKVLATKGNLNNHIGVPLTLLSVTNDVEIAIVEMGANHIGEIANLSEIANPDYGIITNIGKAHLEGFGGYEGVIKAKSELYDYIKKNNGKLFVNHSDTLLLKLSENAQSIYYNDQTTFVKDYSITPFVNASIISSSKNLNIQSKIIGAYNIDNIMAAVTIGMFFKVSPENIETAINDYTPDNNRSQFIKSKYNDIIMDAYNANPSSMNVAIKNFENINVEKKVVILGDMFELGTNSKAEHQNICQQLEEYKFFKVILIGDNFMNTNSNNKFITLPTTQKAIEYLKNNPLKDVNILIKGSRKMQLEKIVEFL